MHAYVCVCTRVEWKREGKFADDRRDCACPLSENFGRMAAATPCPAWPQGTSATDEMSLMDLLIFLNCGGRVPAAQGGERSKQHRLPRLTGLARRLPWPPKDCLQSTLSIND